MYELATMCYFVLLPNLVLVSHVFVNDLTKHGYISTGISKNNYKYFYLYGLLLFLLLSPCNLYSVHLGRRLVETLIFRYSRRNKMSLLQFVHGIIYYTFLCLHLKDKSISHGRLFIVLNAIHSLSHYYVFIKKRFAYSHYIAEAMIYTALFWDIGTLQLLFNLLYVISFVFSSIKNRCGGLITAKSNRKQE